MRHAARLAGMIAALAALGAPVAAHATPIVYTMTGTATGALGGVSFQDATITFTETTNTSQSVNEGAAYLNDATTTVSVAGVGTATVNDGSFGVVEYPGEDVLVFYDYNTNFAYGVEASQVSTYALQALSSPIAGTAMVQGEESTSLGLLDLTALDSQATFDALTPTPEPSSLTLLSLGALGLAGLGWRRYATGEPAL